MGIFDSIKNAIYEASTNYLDEFDKNRNNINNRAEGLSYDELHELREELRQDTQNPFWEDNLKNMDRKIEIAKIPIVEKIHSMSDDELTNEIKDTWDKYQEDDKHFSKDKRSYEERSRDNEYKQHARDYRYFDNLRIEEQHRYAEKNPDKFPKHREHGFNLYKKDDD